ncbi:MAG: menaquinone biosynthesis protein [Desulfobacteraceae bacterium]|nr:menaquinone biosynthesis protein [Desulfobacteraceae bacterium]
MGRVDAGPRARIGMVNFINTAPLYEVWRQTVSRPDWRVTEAPPTTLNRLLQAGELDLGFVSSHEYAARPDEYRILGDLSISASGPVGSVLLLCRVQPEQLGGKLVILSSQSQTSASLVRIVLEEFYGVTPHYRSGTTSSPEAPEAAAVLAIGDEALRHRADPAFPVRLDLGEIWRRHTGLPFVFAVWAVRREICEQDMEAVAEIHRELRRCVDEGRGHLRAIAARVAPRIPMPEEECHDYLRGLEYDLGEAKRDGLRLFFEHLIRRGEAPSRALPLRICG